MSHANAPLTPTGRLRLARCVVEDGWPPARAAERFGVSLTTARRWASRYREHGKAGMVDRSSRPHHSPTRTPLRRERRVIGLRVSRRWGPARIAYHLGMQPSTVHKILSRFGCVRLAFTDPATGAPVRATKRRPQRYEHAAPGDLVHVDIKKLGRIPDGGGHKFLGRAKGRKNRSGVGYWYIHNAVDDHSRLAYSELLTDERKETAAAFWRRACAYFADAGITVKRVLTDNGMCYRSHAFADALGPDIKHKRTRPYRPQTNGKVERYNRTLLEEWAYARPYTSESERQALLPAFLHHYNHHRGHTALRGASPADRVTNLRGQYIYIRAQHETADDLGHRVTPLYGALLAVFQAPRQPEVRTPGLFSSLLASPPASPERSRLSAEPSVSRPRWPPAPARRGRSSRSPSSPPARSGRSSRRQIPGMRRRCPNSRSPWSGSPRKMTLSVPETTAANTRTAISATLPADARGTVTFRGGGQERVVDARDGRASTSLTFTEVGSTGVEAVFTPSATSPYAPATASAPILVEESTGTTLILNGLDAPGYVADPVRFEAVVTPAEGTENPQGRVEIVAGSQTRVADVVDGRAVAEFVFGRAGDVPVSATFHPAGTEQNRAEDSGTLQVIDAAVTGSQLLGPTRVRPGAATPYRIVVSPAGTGGTADVRIDGRVVATDVAIVDGEGVLELTFPPAVATDRQVTVDFTPADPRVHRPHRTVHTVSVEAATVDEDALTVTVTGPEDPVEVGHPAAFRVTVAPQDELATPDRLNGYLTVTNNGEPVVVADGEPVRIAVTRGIADVDITWTGGYPQSKFVQFIYHSTDGTERATGSTTVTVVGDGGGGDGVTVTPGDDDNDDVTGVGSLDPGSLSGSASLLASLGG